MIANEKRSGTWKLILAFVLKSEAVLIRPKSQNSGGVVGEKKWSHFRVSEMLRKGFSVA